MQANSSQQCQKKNIWQIKLSSSSLNNTPSNSQSDWNTLWLWLFFQLIIIFQFFNALAILSKNYYNLSINRIEHELGLNKDLSTSTLVSFGNSTPELSIAIQAVFIDSNLAFGVIFGSSLFNTFLLGGIACMFGRKDVTINWFPVMRDILQTIVVIAISIGFLQQSQFNCNASQGPTGALISHAQTESQVGQNEIVLVFVQVLQIAFMKQSAPIEKWIKSFLKLDISGIYSSKSTIDNPKNKELIRQIGEMILYEGRLQDLQNLKDTLIAFIQKKRKMREFLDIKRLNNDQLEQPKHSSVSPLAFVFSTFVQGYKVFQENARYQSRTGYKNQWKNLEERNQLMKSKEPQNDQLEVALQNPLEVPDGFLPKVKWLVDQPINQLQYQTIPEVAPESTLQMVSFLISLLQILLQSIIEMILATEISRMVNQDPIVIGIIVLSLGSGIPDLLEVIEDLKEGESQNAVLNSTGSNMFVQAFCLPFPLFCQQLFNTKNQFKAVQNTPQLQESQIVIIVTFLAQLVLFILFKWKLKTSLGFILLICYSVSVALLIWINWNSPILQSTIIS